MNIVDGIHAHGYFAKDVDHPVVRCACGELLGCCPQVFDLEDFRGAWTRHLRGVFHDAQMFLDVSGYSSIPKPPVIPVNARLRADGETISLCSKCKEPAHGRVRCGFARKARDILKADGFLR